MQKVVLTLVGILMVLATSVAEEPPTTPSSAGALAEEIPTTPSSVSAVTGQELLKTPSSFGAAATKAGTPYLIGGFSEVGMHASVMRVDGCGDEIKVLQDAEFPKRSFFPALLVGERAFLFGGYHVAPPSNVLGDVWSAPIGGAWKMEAVDPEWEAREAHGAAYLRGHFYLFGGVTYFRPEKSAFRGVKNPSHLRTFGDVWRSSDGFKWTLIIKKAPWGPRRSFGSAVLNGYIWLWGGVNDETGKTYNDVWRSKDGARWDLVTSKAPWSPRAPTNHAPTFNGRLWVVGGDALRAPKGANWHNARRSIGLTDVWSSADGANWTRAISAAPFGVRTGAFVFEMKCSGTIQLGLYGGHSTPDKGNGREFYRDLWTSKNGREWHSAAAKIVH